MALIEVSHLTKEFRLGPFQGLRHWLLRNRGGLTANGLADARAFKALDDVSFSVSAGEVVGIVGHNGAGKSTLLKMLARISRPTRGVARVHGRINPLIEVGAGFIPEFSGRENVYLNGAILGLSRNEIARKFDEIVEFSELARFIDTPVKRYSSGMQMKLAFAVATSIDAEVLIVDEVLAVGDIAFQRKCYDRINSLINSAGRTVLVVSHNIRQIERICSRVLFLHGGKLVMDGEPTVVCNAFYEASDAQMRKASTFGRHESSGDVELVAVETYDSTGSPVNVVHHLQDVEFRITYRVVRPLDGPIFGVGIHTTDFLFLATGQSIEQLVVEQLQPGVVVVKYLVRKFPFLPGVYSLRLGVALGDSFHPVFYAENVASIEVATGRLNRAVATVPGEGFVGMDGEWSVTAAGDRSAVTLNDQSPGPAGHD